VHLNKKMKLLQTW